MKVLFILDLYKPHVGGVEILFENIITRLEKKGYKIGILTSRFDKSLSEYEKKGNIEIYRVGTNRYNFMFFSIFKGIKLTKKYDLIHTTTYNSAIPSWFIGKFSGKKVVLTVHEIFGQLWYRFLGWKGFFFKQFEDLIFKFNFDKYICVSNYTKNSIRLAYGIEDKKLVTVYNGVDYDVWNISNYKKNNIEKIRKDNDLENYYVGLFFGRPGISKGLEYYVKSIPEIVKSIPNFKAFLIVSNNDKKRFNFIDNLIKKLNISSNVILKTSVKYTDLGKYILASNLVIVPSLAEGFGFSAVETCALGQKLVVSEIASLPEVVSGKINFVNPGDEKSIAEGVKNFYNNQYLEIPEKKFFWNDNISKTLNIYNELIGK